MVPWAQFLKCPRAQSKAPCFGAPRLERRWLAEIDAMATHSSDVHSEQAIRYELLGTILENELKMQS